MALYNALPGEGNGSPLQHSCLESNSISSLTKPSSAEQTEKTSPLSLQRCEQAPCGAVSRAVQHYTKESPQRREPKLPHNIRAFSVTFVRPLTYPSLVAQLVSNLPSVQETRVWSLDRKDPLEKEMADYSSNLAWEIPWTEEPGGLQSLGCCELDMTEQINYNNRLIHAYMQIHVYVCTVCMQYIYIHKCIFFAVTYFNS